MKKQLISIALLITTMSCTDAAKAKLGGYGGKYKIEVLSGGQVVRTYFSTGDSCPERQSDRYFFMDQQTGKLVEISGDVIITQIE